MAASMLVLVGCATPSEEPTPEVTYRSVPQECYQINELVAQPATEFLDDILAPDLPGTITDSDKQRHQDKGFTELQCTVEYLRSLTDRRVDITFTLATKKYYRPTGAIPVQSLGDIAYQDSANRVGPAGAFSTVVFRVRNLEVKVSASGSDLGPTTPDIHVTSERAALRIATLLADKIDEIMPRPE
ncbi:hypothetical protein ACL02S_13790 [Nocardia sp. 004]|uniref:hypothetical protein n=1 Tax=Nocardia sp. 004 TaxID=3385978 RepID=UPI0039A27BCA